jgi:hypothetical protein
MNKNDFRPELVMYTFQMFQIIGEISLPMEEKFFYLVIIGFAFQAKYPVYSGLGFFTGLNAIVTGDHFDSMPVISEDRDQLLAVLLPSAQIVRRIKIRDD